MEADREKVATKNSEETEKSPFVQERPGPPKGKG
jgi:hypothetical protein